MLGFNYSISSIFVSNFSEFELHRYKNLPYRIAIVDISTEFLCHFLKMFNLVLICSVNNINIGCEVTFQGFQKKLSLSKLMIKNRNFRLLNLIGSDRLKSRQKDIWKNPVIQKLVINYTEFRGN